MRERTDAEIEAVLTAYHGADGWDHNDRNDMRAALAVADAVASPDARIKALEKFEPRGCPTPGACSAADRIEALEAALTAIANDPDTNSEARAYARNTLAAWQKVEKIKNERF